MPPKKPVSFVPVEDVRSMFVAKLATSGLDERDAEILGMEALDAAQTAAHGPFWPVPSLYIPYHDLDGRSGMRGGKGWPDFYRLRRLRDVPGQEDAARYLQPPGTRPHAYLPRNAPGGWAALAADPAEELLITEGELKAAKGCREGFCTLGLGGVHSWRAIRQGHAFLPELERFDWVRRNVTICFDADMSTNGAVRDALMGLADALTERGALPRLLALPDVYQDGRKTGLDDYLVERGPLQLRRLLDDELASEPLTLAAPLWGLNRTWSWVRSISRVAVAGTTRFLEPSGLAHATTSKYEARRISATGRVSSERVNAAGSWLAWPLRREVDDVVYRPGLPPTSVVETEDGGSAYNIWTGWGVAPVEGDVTPFLDLVNHLFSGTPRDIKDFVMRWLAYPLQNPGAKMSSSVVVYGLAQGSGKSSLGYTMAPIYGANFSEVGERDFHSNFNTWAARKQFVMGDDVSSSDTKRTDREEMKKLISQKNLRINEKQQPIYDIEDCINYLWTTNQPDALLLEDYDRRFLIHEVMVDPLPDEFYIRYYAWLHDEGGASHVFRYLLDLDLAHFHPHARAPTTDAKSAMTRVAKSGLAGWVDDLREVPEAVLRLGDLPAKLDIFTVKELRAYLGEEASRINDQALARELARAGFRMVNGGAPLTVKGAHGQRYYAVRDPERWLTATPVELGAHLRGETLGPRVAGIVAKPKNRNPLPPLDPTAPRRRKKGT